MREIQRTDMSNAKGKIKSSGVLGSLPSLLGNLSSAFWSKRLADA